jgi:hypothetical protein
MAKVTCSLSVFTADAINLICASIQATLNIENETEEAGCINDVWATPDIVGKSWSVSSNGAVDTKNEMLLKALNDPEVAVTMTVAGGSYTGTALVTSASGDFSRRALDKGSVSFTGRGALTYTAI